MYAVQHFLMRVGGRRCETAQPHHGEIGPVVAHIAAFGCRDTRGLQQLGERDGFVGDALMQVRNAQFSCPCRDNAGVAPGDDRRLNARRLQHFHAVAIERIEGLHGVAVDGEKQAAVGEHAVDVENHQFHAARAVVRVFRCGDIRRE